MPIDAASIMTQRVITVRPDATVAEVARLLTNHEISAVPVCDKGGTLLGMVSEGDLMRPFGLEHALRRAWWLNMLADAPRLVPALREHLRTNQRCARDLMTTPAVTAGEQATLGEIADLLMRHRIKRVPIVRDGKVVGVVSRADLVRAIACNPDAFEGLAWRPARAGGDVPAPQARGASLGRRRHASRGAAERAP